MRGVWTAAAVAWVALSQAACAHQAGKGATEGAVGELQQRTGPGESQGEDVTEKLAEGAVQGALAGLDDPESMALLGEAAARIAAGALRGATRTSPAGGAHRASGLGGSGAAPAASPAELFGEQFAQGFAAAFGRAFAAQLGAPEGEQAAAAGLSLASERLSAAAARGARSELEQLLPGCEGLDRASCTNRRVSQLSRDAASGWMAGVRSSLGLLPLAGALLVGVMFGVLAMGALYALVASRAHLATRAR